MIIYVKLVFRILADTGADDDDDDDDADNDADADDNF